MRSHRRQTRLVFFISGVIFLVLIILTSGIVNAEFPAPPSSEANRSIQDLPSLISSEPAGRVVVYFFYNQNCGECQEALIFMKGFRERHPDVVMRSFDVANNVSNQQLFQQFNKRYNVPFSPVPAVFVGEWALMNVGTIELHLDDVVVQVAQNPDSAAPVRSDMIPTSPLNGKTYSDALAMLLVIIAGLAIPGLIVIIVLYRISYKYKK